VVTINQDTRIRLNLEGESYLDWKLLDRGRIFEEAVIAEKPLTVVTYLLGKSCQISNLGGHVRAQDDAPQSMRVDIPFCRTKNAAHITKTRDIRG
jgi:hypothetical protein